MGNTEKCKSQISKDKMTVQKQKINRLGWQIPKFYILIFNF